MAGLQKALLSLFVILVTFAPGWAQSDPDAEAHFRGLAKLYERQGSEALLVQVNGEVNLARRSFVVGFLDFWASEQIRDEVPPFLRVLADAIYEVSRDVKPLQICFLIKEKREKIATYEVNRYAADVSPDHYQGALFASSETLDLEEGYHYGAGSERLAAMKRPLVDAFYPGFLSTMRMMVSCVYRDTSLLSSEVDATGTVVQIVHDRMTNAYPDVPVHQVEQTVTSLTAATRELQETFLVHFGLLPQFPNDSELDLQRLLVAHAAAYRAADIKSANRYLSSIERLASESGEENPLLAFHLSTIKHQHSRFGFSPGPEEVIEAFDEAWSQLGAYQPGIAHPVDFGWLFASGSARFWVDELRSQGAHGPLQRLQNDLYSWLKAGRERSDFVYHYTLQEIPLQSSEFFAYLEQVAAVRDLYLYAIEEESASFFRDYPGVLESLKSELDWLEILTDGWGLAWEGYPLPPFNPNDTSLVREMRLRLARLRALHESPDEDRLANLESLVDKLDRLDRPESIMRYHDLLATDFSALKRDDLAIPLWKVGAETAEKFGFRIRFAELSTELAGAYARTQDWQKAAFHAGQAQKSLKEDLGFSPPAEGLEVARKSEHASSIEARALIGSGDSESAFRALDEGRQVKAAAMQVAASREAKDQLGEVAQKKRQVEAADRQVKIIESLPTNPTSRRALELTQQELARTREDFLAKSRNIRANHPELYTSVLRFDPLSLPDIQSTLTKETAVVQYFPTETELYIFVVTADSFRLRSVRLPNDELRRLVKRFLRKVIRPDSPDEELQGLSKELYAALITPVTGDIATVETLILIPAASLNALPFAALLDDQGHPLIASKRLVSLAKPTDFLKIAGSQPRGAGELLALANATLDLPAAEKEGRGVKSMFQQGKLFLREEASRANLLQFAGEADVVHLATHGVCDPRNSLNNYLKLSNGEKLTQEEILNLDLLDTSMVTLSACNTAVSDSTEYEFVASIAEAFWIAGSRSVVASIWAVDDNSTEQLMVNFYDGITNQKLSKAESLRQAQLILLNTPDYRKPYFWAGFTLYGDYR